jgi:hypothetical protein
MTTGLLLLLLKANAAVAVTLLVAAAVVRYPVAMQAKLHEQMRVSVARVAKSTH